MTAPVNPRLVSLDLDGTLLAKRPGLRIDYQDPAAVLRHTWPDDVVVRRVKRLLREGWNFIVNTARGQVLAEATAAQLTDAGLHGLRVHHQTAYTTYKAAIQHKARVLQETGAVAHVGDQDMDLDAAIHADRVFIPVDEFRNDSLLRGWCHTCGCTNLNACLGGCYWVTATHCSSCAPNLEVPQ